MNKVFLLLVLFQFKHFLADYIWQTEFHLGKFKAKGWILPLASHCFVHLIITLGILIHFTSFYNAVLFSLFDFFAHFVMDRIKASPGMLGRFKPLSSSDYLKIIEDPNIEWRIKKLRDNKYFWISLGLDQMVHFLTGYIIIYFVL